MNKKNKLKKKKQVFKIDKNQIFFNKANNL